MTGKDVTELETQINQMVYKLYELNHEEVLVVDKEFKISNEEYDVIEIENITA
ncbi:MAG: hypothetical protein GXO81_03765 [Chlorobi bacterium]|nr:hypothetical protein [Chlorobiota bacterium]